MGPDDPGMSEGNQALAFLFQWFCVQTTGGYQFIDVRDLARIHVDLLERRKTGRYIAAGHYYGWREFAALLEAESGRRLWRMPVPGSLLRGLGSVTDVAMRMFRFESILTHEAACFATQWVVGNDSKTRAELALEFRPGAETIRETVAWLEAQAHIRPSWGWPR
jgi:nucleoside-diphosphate-sugar epimerase